MLRARFGHQQWWPGDSAFEICTGAILTQNTSWIQVERALANLHKANALSLLPLHHLPLDRLAALIRPAGCPNIKTRRIRAFTSTLIHVFDGSLEKLFAGPTQEVRTRLLAIHGIGPETADCMLLYAGGHASFVIDAYTRRVFDRHAWTTPQTSDDELRRLCQNHLQSPNTPDSRKLWGDFHAQMVRVGKDHCTKRNPDCEGCPLHQLLPGASTTPSSSRHQARSRKPKSESAPPRPRTRSPKPGVEPGPLRGY